MTVYSNHRALVEQRLHEYMERTSIQDKGKAMEPFAYSVLFEGSPKEAFNEDFIGGSDEKQIDLLRIVDFPETKRVHLDIVQVKSKATWEANTVSLVNNGLRYIFEYEDEAVNALSNSRFRDKIRRIRQLWSEYGSANVDISVHFVTLGDESKIPKDFNAELEHLKSSLKRKRFGGPYVQLWGANELWTKIETNESSCRGIDYVLQAQANIHGAPAILRYRAKDLDGVVITVTGKEIARMVSAHAPYVFEQNIRPYLGDENRVNKGIYSTSTSPEEAHYFWFLNNGITIVCDSFDVVEVPGRPSVKLTNLQIVNGCQTSSVLATALQNKAIQCETEVLVKIFSSRDLGFVDRITFSTNNQTSIGSRDLKANTDIQKSLQTVFGERYSILYERKEKEFASHEGTGRQIVTNQEVGAAYLAVGMRRPDLAASEPAIVFSGTYHEQIFGQGPEFLFYTWKVYSLGKTHLSQAVTAETTELRTLRNHGTFHLARVLGAVLMGTEQWPRDRVEYLAETLSAHSSDFESAYLQAVEIVLGVLRTLPPDTDLVSYLQSESILAALTKSVTQALGQRAEDAS